MKHTITLLLILLTAGLYANDTLTRKQVFNFSVGDTFDYKLHYYSDEVHLLPANYYTFERKVIDSFSFSPGMDTVTFTFRSLTTGIQQPYILTDLNSYQYYTAIPADTMCSFQLQIDSPANFNYRKTNRSDVICFESGYRYATGDGLGVTYSERAQGNFLDGHMVYDTTLIYFNKQGEVGGAPYTEMNGSQLINYIPLPEDCAIWTQTIPGYNTPEAIREQIRTGNRIAFGGHAYIELLYTYFNLLNGSNTQDSLIGYFRNDTLGRKVYFTELPGQAERVLYDFTLLNGTRKGLNHITLGTIQLGGYTRTKWRYTEYIGPYYNPSPYYVSYISGIGGIEGGFIEVQNYYLGANYFYHPELVCFSVCGTTLYPSASAGSCAVINSLEEEPEAVNYWVSPTVGNGSLYLSGLTSNSLNYEVYNTNGQLLKSGQTETNSYLNFSGQQAGMYILLLKNDKGNSKSYRFIIQ